MKLKVKGNKKELILNPEDRDRIIILNDELSKLDKSKKELIEYFLEHKLINSFGTSLPDPYLRRSITGSISSILSRKSTGFLLSMVQNYEHINITLDTLEKEKLINKNTYDFIFNLSVKYGSFLSSSIDISERPYQWANITIDPLVHSRDNVEIQVEIERIDRNIVNFRIDLNESLFISRIFLKQMIEAIELVDKELILSFDEEQVHKIEELITKIKDLRKSVESNIKTVEESVFSGEITPKSEN